MTKLVFLDTETTGLADDCDIWEIGLIERIAQSVGDPIDQEYRWLIRPSMATAEPTGLRIGRYYQRIGGLTRSTPGAARCLTHPDTEAVYGGGHTDSMAVAAELAELLDGATIVGAVPDFDARHLVRFFGHNEQCGTWHYHLVDVETFAAGYLQKAPPWGFDDLLDEFDLVYDEEDRHTALGDARMVRDLYDAVLTRKAGK